MVGIISIMIVQIKKYNHTAWLRFVLKRDQEIDISFERGRVYGTS